MVKIKINQHEIDAIENTTILENCQKNGIEIPVFCYHEKLKVAGNCRMCLVEVKGFSKPLASCAMPISDEMEILTESPLVQDCRKGNLEFLLINHPLDCPICDEAGACDLQDITLAYGPETSRYAENKRAIPDKNFGPLIKTSMNRCIHCTRCIRFTEDVAGSYDIIGAGRGEDTEITTFLEKAVQSELAGNLIDICPVGALTSKPFAFKARPWELTKTESIDVMDGVGSHIQIQSINDKIVRILPKQHDEINETWITDKARFSYDGLCVQRLDHPYIRKNGKLTKASWDDALKLASTKLKSVNPDQIAVYAGSTADVETMLLIQELFQKLGIHYFNCQGDDICIPTDHRSNYLFNTTIAQAEKIDACLIIGSNLRWEAPLINTRLRKAFLQHGMKAAYVGPTVDFNFPVDYLGDKLNILNQFWRGTHPFLETLKNAKYPAIIIGSHIIKGENGLRLYHLVHALAQREGWINPRWNGFNIVHRSAHHVGALDVGFTSNKLNVKNFKPELIYLLNEDDIELSAMKDSFIIYQGHHGDKIAQNADIILPGAAYTEKRATYVNTEGRVQQTSPAISLPGDAKEDWKIIRKLSEYLGHPLSYDTYDQVLEKMKRLHPAYENIGSLVHDKMCESTIPLENVKDILIDSIHLPIENYFMTDPISRASRIMAQCSQALLKNHEYKS